MNSFSFQDGSAPSLPVYLVSPRDLETALPLPEMAEWVKGSGFSAASGEILLVPGKDRTIVGAFFGTGNGLEEDPLIAGALAGGLPNGVWRIANSGRFGEQIGLGFGLGSYRFEAYRRKKKEGAVKLVCPEGVDRDRAESIVSGCFLARDLVNTPVNDMGPDDLEKAVRDLALDCSASVEVISGDALLESNFPMIHAVGRASAQAPRLIDMTWGKPDAPKVTLVGKGVCFDTGGLDIKPPSSMLLMKKDMGGAANVLGLARMIMKAGLDLRLRVLVPAVENSIAGNAFRPGDILTSRAGLTVEIGNTDAEGRLVLADAMALADEEEPEIMIDMATLTGAARVAVGTDLAPFFCHSDSLASALLEASDKAFDPLWRMPLFKPYDRLLSSPIADLNNAPAGGFAGSITAALFLNRFVQKAKEWAHFDIYAWNRADKPHAPAGGEAQAIRALYTMLEERYGN
ncbi:leucyl aminopeptidase family protein [Hoeflea sp. WL0058]|uniref:Leucyl aminopeptidase family protein n=1 Tax=Flavimaribacter sediminis TaxID=2865987 RepID=A0AAE2ZKW9_9HYPH|nr:leucyl aminopeptidase family protein [Flavimaribacter sediminis]MBW8638081.1 leucyl aminopeptidase family protein [Flavimaribacter sediminis]